MDVCPHCMRKTLPFDDMDLCRSRPVSRIECECGYVGLPIRTE